MYVVRLAIRDRQPYPLESLGSDIKASVKAATMADSIYMDRAAVTNYARSIARTILTIMGTAGGGFSI